MGSLLRPDAKALVWLALGWFVVPRVVAMARTKMG
jgi:hypothetical protein